VVGSSSWLHPVDPKERGRVGGKERVYRAALVRVGRWAMDHSFSIFPQLDSAGLV